MKKLLAFFIMILFAGVVTFSLMSFKDDGPKKAKSEKTCEKGDTATCKHHDASANQSCCKGEKSCKHDGSKCEKHQEAEKK